MNAANLEPDISPYTQKITVDELQRGMFVEALDRPWLETDFELQGLLVRSDDEIQRLRGLCTHVYITRTPPPGAAKPRAVGAGPILVNRVRDRQPRSFREELHQARVIRDEARLFVNNIHADLRAGKQLDTAGARDIIAHMMDSVARHPDAMLWFTNLKDWHEYTALHSMRVAMLAITLAGHIGYSDGKVEEMGVGALLHDVGKIKVPLHTLDKPGQLTDQEFKTVKKHPIYGAEILRNSRDLSKNSLEVVLAHHERMNGTGYPRGLVGNEISFYSQIVSITDVYDAITSDRSYHKGRTPADALKLMHGFEGNFNVDLLGQFVECIGNYPTGTLVELNTGEVGFVLPNSDSRDAERPTVLLVLDHKKRRYYPQRIRDLAQFSQFIVTQVLASGAYGIDVNDYAEQLE